MDIKSFLSSPIVANRNIRWLSLFLVVFLVLAGIANYAYFTVRCNNLDVEAFVGQLHKKEAYADKMLENVMQRVEQNGILNVTRDQSLYAESEKNDIAIFILKGDSICYWSNNSVDVRSAGEVPYQQIFYGVTRNSYCLGIQRADANYRYVAFVPFRQKLYTPNASSVNSSVRGFSLPNEVNIVERSEIGAVEIKSAKGSYLFSLKNDLSHAKLPLCFGLCLLATLLALLALWGINNIVVSMARNNKIPRSWAAVFALTSLLFVALFVAIKWPMALYDNVLFAYSYYRMGVAPSLGHLVIFTILCFWLFCVMRKIFTPLTANPLDGFPRWVTILLGQVVSGLLFLIIYCLTVNLVHHSSMDVSTALIQEISMVTLVGLSLVIPWFVSSFYMATFLAEFYTNGSDWRPLIALRVGVTAIGFVVVAVAGGNVAHVVAWSVFSVVSLFIEGYYLFTVKRPFFLLVLQAFIIINLSVYVCYIHCQQRNSESYEQLAERLTDNNELLHNANDEAMMTRNGNLIMKDKTFKRLMTDTSANRYEELERYLLDSYFDGFGNKYEFDVQIHPVGEPFMVRKGYFDKTIKCKTSFLSNNCMPVTGSGQFYFCKKTDLPLAYVGVFRYWGNVAYVLLYPNLSVYRQGQDVNFYTPSNGYQAPDLSVAKFYNGELLFVSGDYHYPSTSSWIPDVNKKNFHVYKDDCTHYVSRFAEGGYLVVTKTEQSSYTYFIFVSYFCALFAIGTLFYSLYWWFSMRRRHSQGSIMTRMQIWLLGPMLFAFIVLASISMYFFMGQYKSKAINSISEQANSVQLNIQQKVGFLTSLHSADYRRLAQDLKDLSNLFRTDIILYDAYGRQVATSRSTFLNERRRLKRLMYPVPHFMHQAEFFNETNYGNDTYFSYYTYLYNQRNQMVGYVNLRSFTAAEQMQNEVFNLLVVLIDVYLVIVLLTIVIGWLLSRRLVKPVEMLADQFKEIKLTGANTKVEYKDNDELGSLVLQYNAMVDKLQLSAEQLAKSQREMAWRDMARRIAHEIKNPLTPMKLSVQMAQMKQQRDPENFPEYFEKTSSLLIEQIDNLSRIASEFSTFAKTTVTVREEVDLASKVRSVVALFENNPEGVRFETDMHDISSAMVWSDNKQILQVFNNLFKNAIQAIPDGVQGLIKVDFQIKDESAFISITDNGCGIPEENLQTIFQPNFTTKTSGMGLGLSIVKTIVNIANGEIWVDSKVGVGTTFYISIPLIKPGEKSDDVAPQEPAPTENQ